MTRTNDANGATISITCSDALITKDIETTKSISSQGRHYSTICLLLILCVVTVFSYPVTHDTHSYQYVWWCGWLTAIATGLGALPFCWIREIDTFSLGICNALAAGMMLAATCCLAYEGIQVTETGNCFEHVFIGVIIGIVFIKATKIVLDNYEDVHIANLDGLNAKKALLIMAVMTLHSISEGIGVGVSFGGQGGEQRGLLVSITLAIHNIPEGLAISLILIPKGMSVMQAALWCTLSSLPQPIFAVPAFLFVEQFLPFLPVGLGFAGGAMGFVAIMELLPESVEATKDKRATAFTAGLTLIAMLNLQFVIKGEYF